MASCNSCRAEIVWVYIEKADGTLGKSTPMDPRPRSNGNLVKVRMDGNKRIVRTLRKGEEPPVGHGRYMSHFATCKNAKQHRRSR